MFLIYTGPVHFNIYGARQTAEVYNIYGAPEFLIYAEGFKIYGSGPALAVHEACVSISQAGPPNGFKTYGAP